MTAASKKMLLGSRVLVAEDDPFIAFDIMKSLHEAGAETLGPALSLARALELACTQDLNCAVLDVMLRDGLVFPAASILRQRGAGLVFYTGYRDPESIKQDWPSAQVLFKPAPSQLLVRTVRAACSFR
jgi:two-component system, response regulator PdtaR